MKSHVVFSVLHRAAGRARQCLSQLGMWTLFAMMALMVADVVGRKAFNKPLLGAVELIELLLLVSVYAAIPLVSARREHINIELIDNLLPEALGAVRNRLGEIFCTLLMLGCAWFVAQRAVDAFHDGGTTTLLRIPFWPAYVAVAVLLLADALSHLLLATGHGGENLQ